MKNSVSFLVLAAAFSIASPAGAVTISLAPLNPSAPAVAGATQSCSVPNSPAAISGTAFFDMPAIAQEQGVGGVSVLEITLSGSGRLTSESVVESSENRFLDEAALRSAHMTRFQPEVVDCQRVGGSYLYKVEF